MATLINKTWKGIYYSEFVAAWNMATLEGITPLFKDWLNQLEYNGDMMPPQVASEIYTFARAVSQKGLINCAERFIKKTYEITIITSAEGGSIK